MAAACYLTDAALSVGFPHVSRGTDAHERSDEVLASHAVAGAVVQAVFTLVLVWNTGTTCEVHAFTLTPIHTLSGTALSPPTNTHRELHGTHAERVGGLVQA